MAKLLDGTRIYGSANVDTAVYVGANVYMNVSNWFVGNSTANSTANSIRLAVSNSTGAAIINPVLINVATVNVATVSVGVSLVGNSTGLYHTGTINAASLTVGAIYVANATGSFHTGNVTGNNFSIGTYGAATNNYYVNTSLIFIGNSTSNSSMNVNGHVFNQNSTSNATINTSGFFINGGTVANSTGANNAFNLNGVAPSSYVNVSGNYTITGVHTHNANVVFSYLAGISANNTYGSNGQVLTTNGTVIYWGDNFINNIPIAVTNVSISGVLTANASNGTSGQVLTSSGTGVYWSTISGGGGGGGGGGASVSISSSPPGGAAAGDLWWDSSEGTLKIYYNDGTSYQWVEASQTQLTQYTTQYINTKAIAFSIIFGGF